MIDIEFLKKSGFFQEKKVQKNRYIFKKGDVDNNLYIILNGKILVEQCEKTIDVQGKNEFFGEGSISDSDKKEVSIKALEKTDLLYIDGKDGLEKFVEKFPKEGFELMKYIIKVTNGRLLRENKQILANYEILKSIIGVKEINNKNIFGIIEKFKSVTGFDYILYFEVNPAIENYLVLKYDTREYFKLQDEVIEKDDLENLDEIKEIEFEKNNIIQKLCFGNENLGYMIFGKKEEFNDEDNRLIENISDNITGILKQKEMLKEQLNKNYMKNL